MGWGWREEKKGKGRREGGREREGFLSNVSKCILRVIKTVYMFNAKTLLTFSWTNLYPPLSKFALCDSFEKLTLTLRCV